MDLTDEEIDTIIEECRQHGLRAIDKAFAPLYWLTALLGVATVICAAYEVLP